MVQNQMQGETENISTTAFMKQIFNPLLKGQ